MILSDEQLLSWIQYAHLASVHGEQRVKVWPETLKDLCAELLELRRINPSKYKDDTTPQEQPDRNPAG